MKTKFLIFSNKEFLPRAIVAKESFEEIYSSRDFETEIIIYESIKAGPYLDGFAEMRIRVVEQKLKDYDQIIMLGADCVLYHNIDALLSLSGKVVLVPHVITPPLDAAKFYRTGHANGDVVCFRSNSIEIIQWLLSQPMRHDTRHGMFFEQTLLSSLPFIFDDIAICKDTTINFAYYNFFERKLERKNNRFLVNQRPLALCQFSGYLEGQPDKIGRYYRGPVPSEDMLDLFRQYEERIQAVRLRPVTIQIR